MARANGAVAAPRGRVAAQTANSRRRRKRRTGKKTIHYMLLIIFLLSAGIVLSLTTFFKIEAVTVVGTDKYPPEEVALASGIQLEENLFRVSTGQVEELLLEQYPYIESVEISRKLPPSIEITVTQSVPAAAVMSDKEIVLITREGKVLERGQLLAPPEVPVVKGIPTAGVAPGQKLDEQAAEGLRMLDYLFAAMEATGFQNITNVDITDPYNMLIVYENRLLLRLGTEASLDHKLAFIQTVLDDLGPEQEGRIDASRAQTKKNVIYKDISLAEALALERGETLEPTPLTPAPADEAGKDGDAGEAGQGEDG